MKIQEIIDRLQSNGYQAMTSDSDETGVIAYIQGHSVIKSAVADVLNGEYSMSELMSIKWVDGTIQVFIPAK